MIVTSAASSHQNSRSNQPRLDAIDDAHATVIAIAISSIIPGAAIANLVDGALEERPAAPDEHERAEHRPDPGDAVELVAEPVHDHLARDDHRDRDQQRQPEPAAEHLRVVPGVLVMTGEVGPVGR